MATAASHRDVNEFVKCVIVGDPGVGKTCLVCARACDTKFTLQQLVKTHVASVWAIDHYRNDREVLEHSWRDVDGVNISLRLWDTFGYHDKDRGFAYSRADVVLLCFSTVCPNSLRNVRRVWYPEIKRAIPSTPIVLVGTQVDLRYLYNDEEYLKMNKGLLYRNISENDIISPEQGREVAKEIGAPYYEASVLTYYGVYELFDNVVRAAVCDRRKVRFWNTDLRKLRHPLMQRPMDFPRPKHPKVVVPCATFQDDLSRLLYHQSDCDVIFILQGNCIQAHKIVLIVAADIFHQLFTMDLSDVVISPSPTNSGGMSVKTSATDLSEDDLFQEMDYSQKLISGSVETGGIPDLSTGIEAGQVDGLQMETQTLLPYKEVNMPAFYSVHLQRCDDPYNPGQSILQTVVTVNSDISPRAFEYILQYLYTGKAREDYDILEEGKRAAELLGLNNLLVMISSFQTNEAYLNAEAENLFHRTRCQKLRELALEKKLLTDITFEVDDGVVSAHKALLMARCDMMFAMFTNDFLEASAKLIAFPGVSIDTFHALQEYLYTDERPAMMGVDCLDLIEVANRLCLNRLIKLTEEYMVRELNKADEAGEDIMEDVINMLEPSQFLNADQLANYCLFYLGTHFKDLTKHYTKMWKGLKLVNQIYIDKHRYPPKWYEKEVELFERARQVSVKRQPRQNVKRPRSSSGCLCFSRRSGAKIQRSMSDDHP